MDHTAKISEITDRDRQDFLTTLLAIDKGQVVDRATEELARLAEEVGRWADKGKLTLEITIEPVDKETFPGTGDIILTGQVKISAPHPKHGSVFRMTGVAGALEPLNPNDSFTG